MNAATGACDMTLPKQCGAVPAFSGFTHLLDLHGTPLDDTDGWFLAPTGVSHDNPSPRELAAEFSEGGIKVMYDLW